MRHAQPPHFQRAAVVFVVRVDAPLRRAGPADLAGAPDQVPRYDGRLHHDLRVDLVPVPAPVLCVVRTHSPTVGRVVAPARRQCSLQVGPAPPSPPGPGRLRILPIPPAPPGVNPTPVCLFPRTLDRPAAHLAYPAATVLPPPVNMEIRQALDLPARLACLCEERSVVRAIAPPGRRGRKPGMICRSFLRPHLRKPPGVTLGIKKGLITCLAGPYERKARSDRPWAPRLGARKLLASPYTYFMTKRARFAQSKIKKCENFSRHAGPAGIGDCLARTPKAGSRQGFQRPRPWGCPSPPSTAAEKTRIEGFFGLANPLSVV